ncbi:MAG TPA: DUF4349 domain-containing protein [Verrucomicrobiae bacterium]|jgi:hypothetical protein|nr:DUF4349 domain-containing protein [Verrucomicrobiae bacterium]
MSLSDRMQFFKNSAAWKGIGLGVGACFLLLAALALSLPHLLKAKSSANESTGIASSRMLTFVTSGREESFAPQDASSVVHADVPKIIHKAQLDLLVGNCAETQKKIEALAASESGFVESSTLEENSGRISLRVPGARFEAVRGKLRELAIRVRQDSVTAADVSKQYVDREARLRNLRAEEQQFLEVMKKAHSVTDILEVTKSLAEIRGEIESADAEFRHLKDEIDMAEIDINLAAQVSSGVHWAPGSTVKSAWNDLLQSLANFVDFLIWLVVNLPVFALWTVTIFFLLVVCWYVVRKAGRAMRAIFGKKPAASGAAQTAAKT